MRLWAKTLLFALSTQVMFIIHAGYLNNDSTSVAVMDGRLLMCLSFNGWRLRAAEGCFLKLGGSEEDQDHTSGWRISGALGENQTVIWLSQHIMRALLIDGVIVCHRWFPKLFTTKGDYLFFFNIDLKKRHLSMRSTWSYCYSISCQD